MDGILLVDKPADITSFAVVNAIKRKYGFSKVGHAGTLDPFATGLLIILINKATKMFDLLSSASKRYSGTIKLGTETDTQDRTGTIIREYDNPDIRKIETDVIEKTRASFLGKIKQVPPMVSALHYNGERLYKLAHKGITVDLQPREIEIHEFVIKKISLPFLEFSAHVSKGTYIRTLCNDFGRELGVFAHLYNLTRQTIGPFKLTQSLSLKKILSINKGSLFEFLIDIDEAKIWIENNENISLF